MDVIKTVRDLEQSFGTIVMEFLAKRSDGSSSPTRQDVCEAISYGCSHLKALPRMESKPRFQYDPGTGKAMLTPEE